MGNKAGGCKVTFNSDAVKARVENANGLAKAAVMEQVLKDSNYFIRIDQGALRASADSESDFKAGYIAWSAPYAKRVYYTGTPSTDVNANASLMWFEKAKSQFQDDWLAIAQSFVNSEV